MVKLSAKCIVAGDATVGKSTLVQLFKTDGSFFQKNYNMTTVVEVSMKTVVIPDTGDSVELFLCDSPGKDIFYEATVKMWDQPNTLCLVFDVTSETSFSNCAKWLQRVKSKCPSPQLPGILVGNKTDLVGLRAVEETQAQDWAASHGLEYFETSAKELKNIDQPFHALAENLHHLYQEKVEIFKSLM
ncbi:LOW QUALITY PROTEIN: intraflagellar transport protein 27 homolog [Bombina bombina]|uniref:LOW QUALITY PROTEIN: intraflagellar transport protein 27 homolog n=1 Tax=Bombina bombina TaxID=8345 RepID=UPI00235A9B58|nr:LOW QUALITY PROTEIN: intraflagellar transport protein 27 homolog [Bombina bombina]